jgi:YggT family protein
VDVPCLLAQLLGLYGIALFARIILSWFPLSPGGPMASIFGVLYNITEPVLGPVRRVLPSIGMIDLSPIVVFIGLRIISGALCTGYRGFF